MSEVTHMTVKTASGREYVWEGGTYTSVTPDGYSLVFEDFIPDAEETPANVLELIDHYEEAQEMEQADRELHPEEYQ